MKTLRIQPVILAGGSGTRLWPISRGDYPKQLLQLDDELTMLQRTAVRLEGANSAVAEAALLPPLVVCGEDLRFLVATQLNAVTPSGPVIVLEPAARNTAPAIAAAAHVSARDDKDCILVVMPADHVIADAAAFCQAVMTAATACDDGEVVATFGVKPTSPRLALDISSAVTLPGMGCSTSRVLSRSPNWRRQRRWWPMESTTGTPGSLSPGLLS